MIGLALAGGQSKRFGQDKARYQFANQSVNNAALTVNNLLMVCDRVLICANPKNYQALRDQFIALTNVQVIVDQAPFKQHGPLSGLYAATCRYPDEHDYFLLAVDYPQLNANVIATIADNPNSYAVTPKDSHFAISHFQISQHDLKAYLMLGDFHLSHFITDFRQCLPISFLDQKSFTNFNFPEVKNHGS